MIARPMAKLNETIPLLGFGSMRLPKLKNGNVDFEKTKQLIEHSLKNGIKYFDTSTVYHNKQSEAALKYALADIPRDSYYITNKMSMWLCKTKQDMYDLFDYQLQACGVEYFDFYLVHSLTKKNFEKFESFGGYEFLRQKQKEGKIKHLGFSFHDAPDVFEHILNSHDWEFTQIQLNYLDWNTMNADKLYDILEKKDIPCLVMEPVRGGHLSHFPKEIEDILKKVHPDWSISSWAIRWVASHSNVKILLSGMNEIEQLDDNLNSINTLQPFTNEELKAIDDVVHSILDKKPVPCTGCKYCMDCPHGVNIPDCFEIYSQYKIWGDKQNFIEQYEKLSAAHCGTDNCIKCGICKLKCPQHIDIPEKLEEMANCYKNLTSK